MRNFIIFIGLVWVSFPLYSYEVVESKEQVFKYYPVYKYTESTYSSPMRLDDYAAKKSVNNVTNPYPEMASAVALMKMKNGDYDGWLSMMSSDAVSFYQKNTDRDKVLSDWKGVFEKNNVYLRSLVNVGRSQYTYIMVVWEIVNKNEKAPELGDDVSCECLYFGWLLDSQGRWRLSSDVLHHPVFKRYVDAEVYSIQ